MLIPSVGCSHDILKYISEQGVALDFKWSLTCAPSIYDQRNSCSLQIILSDMEHETFFGRSTDEVLVYACAFIYELERERAV